MNCVLAIVLSVVFSLGQIFPAMANSGAGDSGIWVEICAEGGTYLARIDQDEETPGEQCVHCTYCVVASNELNGLNPVLDRAEMLAEFTSLVYLIEDKTLPLGPEHRWPSCRGPPTAQIHTKPVASLFIKESIGIVAQKPGEFPWT